MIFIPAHSSAAGAAATATATTTSATGGTMVPTLSTGSALLGGSRLNTTSTSSSSSSASFGACGGSRKTSMSDSQPLPPLLQQLVNGTFGVAIPDDECERCFQAKRHQEVIEALTFERQSWRIRERMKTASVALVLCLNIGVDPPDVVKIQPCARLECWIDPSSVSAPKAMELIGNNLQLQYERWQPRARYKKTNDPTVEDVKKLCTSLRRAAKSERILFHYNGHGVPKPTANGEIWVFNETFTQYIPLSIFELQSWMAAPSIYVYDCSNAGIIINSFHQFAEQHERDLEKALAAAAGSQRIGGAQQQQAAGQKQLPSNIISYKNCIHLAACSANEILPMNAQLPADLFTSCLTTPINIALKWYAMQEKLELVPRMHADLIDKIPGKVNNRRTMMGELNWIFTAITDTIAWNTLPRDLFQRLFRQDMLVASLFRNFLLAERILKSHDCVPVSHPALPSCHRHPMWSAWDLVVDLALQQLPEILERGAAYKPLPFFEEQLTAFQVWLDRESESRSPPEQLPIVLQVLLSQVHRLRALELLARFLDLGPWAVNFALGVGIFPYVLKLLISPDNELRPVLVFIWAKILAVDPSCQVDLVKEHKYFLAVLQDTSIDKEHRTMAAFVLASIVNNFLLGQTSALQGSLVSICLEQLNDQSWLLRQWLAICLGMLWQNFEQARWSGVRDQANEKLLPLLKDPIPEVRAAAVFALGTFISSVTDRSEEHANHIDRNIAIMLLDSVGDEMSPLVRLEIVNALQWLVLLFVSQFVTVYMHEHLNNPTISAMTTTASGERSASVSYGMGGSAAAAAAASAAIAAPGAMHHSTHSLERHVSMRRGVSSSSISNMSSAASSSATTTSIPFQSFFVRVWQGIYNLSQDPFPKVAETAQKIVAYVRDAALDVITAKEATSGDKGLSASVSLPPSPNTRVNYLNSGESPPVGGPGGVPAHQGAASNWAARLRNNAALIGGALATDPHTLLQRKMRSTSMNDETDSSGGPASLNLTAGAQRPHVGAGAANNGAGDGPGSARSSTSEGYNDAKANPKQIVSTEFIPWAISYFTRPGKQRYATATEQAEAEQTYPVDENSPELRTRFYRYQRNRLVRRRAREEKLQAARIDTQTWVRKAQYTPSIVKLLPYEPQIAVAYREKVRIHDWTKNSNAAVKSFTPPPPPSVYSGGGGVSTASSTPRKHAAPASIIASSSPPAYSNLMGHHGGAGAASRVSTMEFLNAQDVHMVLVGHEDGIIRIWQAAGEEAPRLITAWEGLPVHHSASGHAGGGSFGTGSSSGSGSGSASLKNYRKDPAAGYSAGIVTAWQQCSQQLIVGGLACRFLRVWDVHKELKLVDLPLGAETNVRALAPLSANLRTELLAAGCADGSVLLFDKRCSVVAQEARIRAYRDHTSAILTVCLKENQTTMVTGCSMGRVCVSDLRARGVLHQWEAGTDITAIASHQSADMVACGSANKITVYSQAGRPLSTLRSNEGFMVPKIGHPTCLSFHPYRVMLAAGFLDNTVAIYEPATAATPTVL